MPEQIQLEVVTPDRKVLEASVEEVVLPGEQGYLGVRPGHTPLLVTLVVGELTWTEGGRIHRAALSKGFAEVLSDRVSVLIEAAEIADEIDLARAKSSKGRAEKILAEGQDASDHEFQEARARMARAVCRISVSQKRDS
jgi:F-type H+-transporting ATPase subunit epsilon